MRDWLSHRVASSPDHTALIRAEDGEAWTYTDLDRLVDETAGRLVAHGIETDDRVGVLTPPYVGTVGLVHAAMRIGATFVPLGQELTERELAERVDRADLDAVVCAEPTEDAALGAVEQCDDAFDVPVFSVDDPIRKDVTAVHSVDPEPVDPPEWADSDTLCILFTSGTTGDPKPVPLTAGNVYSSAVASAFRLGVEHEDRWLVTLSLHHMGGLAPVYRSALYGTTLVLREGFDPGGTADDIDTYDVTGVSLVPTMLKRMLDRRGTLSDTLRVVLLGGAPASDELIERCRDYSVPVYPTYGMTEAASQIATAPPRQTRNRLGTVGRTLFGTDVTIVDEDGTPVEGGETGEIVVDGPTVTPGYIAGGDEPDGDERDGDERDAGALDRSEFGPYGLHTGDAGRFDDEGFLYVLNRLDDRIVSGGENVEPGEVVDVLRGFPSIEEAAVIGLDDELWGERVSALLAVGDQFRDGVASGDEGDAGDEGAVDAEDGDGAEANNGETGDQSAGSEETGSEETGSEPPEEEPAESDSASVIDDEHLMAFCRDRLAGFKIPKAVAYIDELPRTVSGTVDREAVREILEERGHDPRDDGDANLETAGFEPAEPTEPAERSESTETDDPSTADASSDEDVENGDGEEGDSEGEDGDDDGVEGDEDRPDDTETDEEAAERSEDDGTADSNDGPETEDFDDEPASDTGDS
ncbi:class I adenylate-forming enzyme family protein [Halorubrum sp. N11]|uniref:class I adenylate-forming enzyme family protein n=1 Tax=Halorubrum sp. N11 TaxID=3402276 RepID=UPI003EB765AE